MLSRLLRSTQRRVISTGRIVPVRAAFSTDSKPPAPKPAPNPNFVGVVGEATENFFDVANARVGSDISIPYEVTVSEGSRELWQSCFYQHDRLYTSTPFAERLGLKAHALPFALMLFQTVSMSHIDDRREVLDLGFSNAIYVRPAFAGDTFHRSFYVKAVRTIAKGTVITMHCTLFNQSNELVFETDKTMLFPGVSNSAARKSAETFVAGSSAPRSQTSILPAGLNSEFEKLIFAGAGGLPPASAHSKRYSGGQLILHTSARPLGKSMNRSLATLLRFQHPLLMNPSKYHDTELVPGPLVLALTTAAAARGLYESMYECVYSSSLLNKVEPIDTIGAITYVHSATEIGPGLEELNITTLGLKNVDVRAELSGQSIPLALFGAGPKPPSALGVAARTVLTRGETDRLTAAHCPVLQDRIVSQVNRRLLRQAHDSPFAMALL